MLKYIAFILLFLFYIEAAPTEAVKLLPRFRSTAPAKSSPSTSTPSGNSVSTIVRMMSGKRGITVTFGNVSVANSISYVLSYTTAGKQEGVTGSVNTLSGTTTRELLFGTCSSGACRYDAGITNMTLSITTQYKSGKKTIRRYRIRV